MAEQGRADRRSGQARRDFSIHDATTPSSRFGRCQHQHTENIDTYSDIMASGRAPSSTPVPTTETAESAGATSTVTAAEWEAMAGFLKNVYDYRDSE